MKLQEVEKEKVWVQCPNCNASREVTLTEGIVHYCECDGEFFVEVEVEVTKVTAHKNY